MSEQAAPAPGPTSLQYYTPVIETLRSLPVKLSHFGYPNVFDIPYRKPSTAGRLEAGLIEFPQDVFWHSKRQVYDDSPVFVGGLPSEYTTRNLKSAVTYSV